MELVSNQYLALPLQERAERARDRARREGSRSKTLRGSLRFLRERRLVITGEWKAPQTQEEWIENEYARRAAGMCRALGLWEKDVAEALAYELTLSDYGSMSLPEWHPYSVCNETLKGVLRIAAGVKRLPPLGIMIDPDAEYPTFKGSPGRSIKKRQGLYTWNTYMASTKSLNVSPIWIYKYGDLLRVRAGLWVSLGTARELGGGKVVYVGWRKGGGRVNVTLESGETGPEKLVEIDPL